MLNYKIGIVTHYYDKIKVAVIELFAPLAVGETVRFERGGESLFEQKITSMQVEHDKVPEAKKGDIVGIKMEQEVKEGAEIYKFQEEIAEI